MTFLESLEQQIVEREAIVNAFHSRITAIAAIILLLIGAMLVALYGMDAFLVGLYLYPFSLGLVSWISCLIADKNTVRVRILKSEIASRTCTLEAYRREVKKIYIEAPNRHKGKSFKVFYKLRYMHYDEIEDILPIATYKEGREVSITLFCVDGYAIDVEANIGNLYSVRSSTNAWKKAQKASRLQCDQVRIYHNHPGFDKVIEPSPADIKYHIRCSQTIIDTNPWITVQSFIVALNKHYEWKYLEYSEDNADGTIVKEYETDRHFKELWYKDYGYEPSKGVKLDVIVPCDKEHARGYVVLPVDLYNQIIANTPN